MEMTKPILLAFFLMSISQGYSKELSLKDYLKEVEEKNETAKASKITIEGLDLRKDEGKLIFRPSIYAQGQTSVDKRLTVNVNAQGDRTDNTLGTVGLMQQFDMGLKAKLGYTLSHTKIYDALSTFLPLPEFNDSSIGLELTQSLWRNFYGVEGKSQETLIEADAKAKKYIEEYKLKNILSSAESVYWSLSEMKKMITVQKENLERAKKLKKWAEERSTSGLGDKSDLLQAEANLKFRDYELKTSEQQTKALTRSFNSLRNLNTDTIDFELEKVSTDYVKSLKLLGKAPLRDDTKAAIEYQKLARANLDLSIERNKPTLELYGAYALNGKNKNQSDAISAGFKTDHTNTSVGVRFNAPLDFGNLVDNIRGYKKEQLSADLTVNQKLFDQDKEWNDLVSKFEDAKNNLNLVEAIESTQKTKYTNERDRLTKGRTTTFQVLNFEQDFAQSELLRIKSELEILNLYSQSKTFLTGGN